MFGISLTKPAKPRRDDLFSKSMCAWDSLLFFSIRVGRQEKDGPFPCVHFWMLQIFLGRCHPPNLCESKKLQVTHVHAFYDKKIDMSNTQNPGDQDMTFVFFVSKHLMPSKHLQQHQGAGSCCTQERGFPPVFRNSRKNGGGFSFGKCPQKSPYLTLDIQPDQTGCSGWYYLVV